MSILILIIFTKCNIKIKVGLVFGFDAEQVTCPTRDDLIRKYPIQEGQKK